QRVLAMRLVVGASLADWMLASQLPEPRQWRGLQLIRWLRSRAQPIHDLLDSRWAPPELSSGGVTRDNYLRAVVNLVREVAEALSFAHQRGVVHRDVKPANILLEQTGRAVLADFNVSTRDQTDAEALLGGTLPYMSPEQLRAMLSDPGAADVGPAADVYSLGIILYELVSGVHPWEVVEAQSTDSVMRQMLASRLQRAPRMPPLARRRSPSVAAIVEKCLAPSIADRYESAEPLAVDLRRWLEERRLRHAKDPGGGERWVRWLRRNAIVASSLAASCAVLFALTGWLALHDAARRARVDKALALVESNWSSMEVDAVERQLEVANTSLQAGDLITPRAWTTEWRDAAARRFDKTVRVWVRRQRDDFRRRADRDRIGLAPVDPNRDALSAYGVLRDPQWERRSSYMFLPPAEREAVAEDIAELLVIAAHRRSDRGGEVASRVPAILERRDDIVELVGRVAAGKQPSMRPDSHEFTLHLAGVAAALDQNDQLAVDRFKTSLSMRPINLPTRYWTKFHHAFCCERLNRLSEAVAGYAACAELRRDSSWPLHNLGLIHLRLGEYSVAEQSFRRALRVDGARGSTRAQLALALHQLDRPVEALEEMDRAIDEFGVRSPETLTNRAVILHQLERVADARRDLNAALELDPDYAPASQALKLLDKTR
ncbi:MAG: serine/threonine-protein kinase, partial [Pirellulaceae bacterium]|nr:serine/threonine-protein kinase [Pirellulaceae bacterium]